MLEVRNSVIHGRGVFASSDIEKGYVFTFPVIIFPSAEINRQSDIYKYSFPWIRNHSSMVIGPANFFNHSNTPNIKILSIDKENFTKSFETLEFIPAETEIFLSYGRNVKF